jgi:hypothetical protein
MNRGGNMKISKELWDKACELELKFQSLKSFVQNPIELTEEDFDIFQKRYEDYLINLDRWKLKVMKTFK